MCHLCVRTLKSKLILAKTQGKLLQPYPDLTKICICTERFIRRGNVFQKNFLPKTCVIVGAVAPFVFNSSNMTMHILEQDYMDNRKVQLITRVTEIYLKIRLFYIGKTTSKPTQYIRSKFK